ncbi:conserved hypothetical protein [Frankia sp. Hr75.2]|nr:conserved hypothetical protein [Frankia sp. Hr75.2]
MPGSLPNLPDRFLDPTRFSLSRYAPARELDRVIDQELAVGLTGATRVDAAGYVTHTALSCVATLSKAEADLAEASPAAAERAHAIVDAFTAVALAEVASLGRRYER